jgi:hypothetical protein
VAGALPKEVAALVARHIHSAAQLETLLALHLENEDWWTAERLGKRLGLPAWSARERLEDLASRGFLEVKTAEDVAFRYAPMSAETAAAVSSLARIYYQRPAGVLSLIHAARPDPVRAFADAFRLKPEDDTDG